MKFCVWSVLRFSEYQSLPNTASFENEGLSSIIQIKLSPTGINGLPYSEIRIYPNPTYGIFWIEGANDISEIEISNALGESLLKYPVISQNHIKIDLSDFEAGIYQVKFIGENRSMVRKVVKR